MSHEISLVRRAAMPDSIVVIPIWADVPLKSSKLELDLVIYYHASSAHFKSSIFYHNTTWIADYIGHVD